MSKYFNWFIRLFIKRQKFNEKEFCELFPYSTNEHLSVKYNLHISKVKRLGRKLGLSKTENHISQVRKQAWKGLKY